MPSNAMKISQLIQQLQGLKDLHGDLDMVLSVSELGTAVAIDGRNVNVAIDLPYGKLPGPAVVMGLWQNERGQITSSPGQAYQVTDGETIWTHDRDAAPIDTPLIVWKRYSGEDRGYRDAQDRWFVYEGGERAIEIVPAGILGWRLP